MAYSVVFMPDAMTEIALLSDNDQTYLIVDVGLSLANDPHKQGDLWMVLGSETWYVLEVGAARVAYAVDDDVRQVTVASVTLTGR